MSSWDDVVGGGVVGKKILEAETTASVQSLLQFPTTGVVGELVISTNTTASAQSVLGGGPVGRKIFESIVSASVYSNLGLNQPGTVGNIILSAVTTASALSQIDAFPRSRRVVTKTSAYAVTADDDVVLTSGSFTLSMPPANSTGNKEFIFKRIDSTVTAALTVSAGSSIDGAATVALNGTLRPFRRILSTGATYVVVGSSNEI